MQRSDQSETEGQSQTEFRTGIMSDRSIEERIDQLAATMATMQEFMMQMSQRLATPAPPPPPPAEEVQHQETPLLEGQGTSQPPLLVQPTLEPLQGSTPYVIG